MSDEVIRNLESSVATLSEIVGRRKTRFFVVLGSGLGAISERLSDVETVPMASVPGFPAPSVKGHGGDIAFGSLGGVECALLRGRVHLYEGRSPHEVVHGVRSFVEAGVRTAILTNAAGGVDENFRPGTLMAIEDHLNYTGMSPFTGLPEGRLGPLFPSMATVWDRNLIQAALVAAAENEVELESGVYAGLLGPAYETPAEVRALRILGASAVGMSTVLEAMAVAQMGGRVSGFSVITNMAGSAADAHESVLKESQQASGRLVSIIETMASRLAVE